MSKKPRKSKTPTKNPYAGPDDPKFPELGGINPLFDGPSPERDELCRNLGIKALEEPDNRFSRLYANLVVWAAIGAKLAEERPEFTGRIGAGRPSADRRTADYWRAVYIRRTIKPGETAIAAIRRAVDGGAKLFAGDNFNSLAKSVSTGEKIIRGCEREFQLAQSKRLRSDCERLKQQKAHNDEMTRLAEDAAKRPRYGLLGLLSEITDADE